jgi:Rrf2 family protein
VLKINRRTDYAVRVILALARRPLGTRLAVQQVQTEMRIPRAFLNRIVADLARADLVHTVPGPKGGIELVVPPAQISLYQVYLAIQGEVELTECINDPQDCPLNPTCPVSSRWSRLQALVVREMEQTNFAQLAVEAGYFYN